MAAALGQGDPGAHELCLEYIEGLRHMPNGYQVCMDLLTNGNTYDIHVKSFCLTTLEYQSKLTFTKDAFEEMKAFLLLFLQTQRRKVPRRTEDEQVRNRVAQLYADFLMVEFRWRWPTFFEDILDALPDSACGRDLWLRILLSVRSKLGSVLIMKTCTAGRLLKVWQSMLLEETDKHVVKICLQVMRDFAPCVDPDCLEGEALLPAVLLHAKHPQTREMAVDCLLALVRANARPDSVLAQGFVEFLFLKLEEAGVLSPDVSGQEFPQKVGELVNMLGICLLDMDSSLCARLPNLLLDFMQSGSPDLTAQVTHMARRYLSSLPRKAGLSKEQEDQLHDIVVACCEALKLLPEHCFERQGISELFFKSYRRGITDLLKLAAAVDRDTVSEVICSLLQNSFETEAWLSAAFPDAEHPLFLVRVAHEVAPGTAAQQLLLAMVACASSAHPHPAVAAQFFDTAVRCHRALPLPPDALRQVLAAFADERGLLHASYRVRCRCAVLLESLTRAMGSVHALRTALQLRALLDPERGRWLRRHHQLPLYEAAARLIHHSCQALPHKRRMLAGLVAPVLPPCSRMMVGRVAHALDVLRRVSRVFVGCEPCGPVLLDALRKLSPAMYLAGTSTSLHASLRLLTHRLVDTLGDRVLPLLPDVLTSLCNANRARDLARTVSLLLHCISRFKERLLPMLAEHFAEVGQAVYTSLDLSEEEDASLLVRVYLTALMMLGRHGMLMAVLRAQEAEHIMVVIKRVMLRSVEYSDRTSQKYCFYLLSFLAREWSPQDAGAPESFQETLLNDVVPACFALPTCPGFDPDSIACVSIMDLCLDCLRCIQQYWPEELHTVLNKNPKLQTNYHSLSLNLSWYKILNVDPRKYNALLKLFWSKDQETEEDSSYPSDFPEPTFLENDAFLRTFKEFAFDNLLSEETAGSKRANPQSSDGDFCVVPEQDAQHLIFCPDACNTSRTENVNGNVLRENYDGIQSKDSARSEELEVSIDFMEESSCSCANAFYDDEHGALCNICYEYKMEFGSIDEMCIFNYDAENEGQKYDEEPLLDALLLRPTSDRLSDVVDVQVEEIEVDSGVNEVAIPIVNLELHNNLSPQGDVLASDDNVPANNSIGSSVWLKEYWVRNDASGESIGMLVAQNDDDSKYAIDAEEIDSIRLRNHLWKSSTSLRGNRSSNASFEVNARSVCGSKSCTSVLCYSTGSDDNLLDIAKGLGRGNPIETESCREEFE